MKGTQSTEFRFNEPTTLAIRHTMTNNNRKQQHCCCSNNSSIAAHRAAAAAAAAAALCMHIKLTSRLLRGHLNQHLTYFYTAKQNKGNATRTKKHHPGFEPRTSRSERQQPTCYPTLSLVRIDRDWYVSICTNRRLGKFDLETKTAPAAGRRREHGRGRPRQSRERRAWRGTSSKHHTEWWT